MNLFYLSKTALKPVSLGLTAALMVACGGTVPQPSSSSLAAQPSSSSLSSSSSSVASTSSVSDGTSLLNSAGNFASGRENFESIISADNANVSWSGEAAFTLNRETANTWDTQLIHPLSIAAGRDYTICFDAKANSNRDININVDTGQESTEETSWLSLMGQGVNVGVSRAYTQSRLTFTASATDSSARIVFSLGGATTVAVQLDNIAVFQGSVTCPDTGIVDGGDPGNGNNNNGILPITTQGNQVLFGGQVDSIAGLSLFWSNFDPDGSPFYTAGVVGTVKSWGGKLIRAAMGVDATDGYLTNPQGNMARVRTVVDAAIANDIYVIIDWHTHNAEDYKSEAISFFQEMARTYGDYDNVIYEIYNEPDCPSNSGPCSWPARTPWSTIKSYAQDVVAAIRAIDSDNLIVVGTPFYSQAVDEAAASPIQGYANIAYTLHFYAGTHKGDIRNKATTALAQGIPLFVTEWGTVDASGDGAVDRNESQIWMDFLANNNISHANWSVSDKVEGASLLKPGASHDGGWSDGDLTESGLFVKGAIQNW